MSLYSYESRSGRCGERLPGIDDEIHQYLMDLIGIGDRLGQIVCKIKLHSYIGRSKLIGQQFDGGFDDLVNIDRLGLSLPLARH